MRREVLNGSDLDVEMQTLSGWIAEDKLLKKSCKFENFATALSFVNKIGELAEAADHHPDITFGWGYADIVLTTHDRGGITDVDTALAQKIDEI